MPIVFVQLLFIAQNWNGNGVNIIHLILDGFNLIWRSFMIMSDIACIWDIFYIIRKNGGRGKLLFLLERLARRHVNLD